MITPLSARCGWSADDGRAGKIAVPSGQAKAAHKRRAIKKTIGGAA